MKNLQDYEDIYKVSVQKNSGNLVTTTYVVFLCRGTFVNKLKEYWKKFTQGTKCTKCGPNPIPKFKSVTPYLNIILRLNLIICIYITLLRTRHQ